MKITLNDQERRLLIKVLTKEKKVLNQEHFQSSWYTSEVKRIENLRHKLKK